MAKRVLVAGFKHESTTFSVLSTDLEAYRDRVLVCGADVPAMFTGTNSEIAGFLEVCAREGWQPVLSVVADASPSGPVTREAYEHIAGRILEDATRDGGVAAVLLQLHGAMVAEHTPDGEGLLLRRLRERVGPGVPIGVTLDLHANVSDDMARYADVIVSYRTYPHVDQRDIAVTCADLVARALAGTIRPITLVRRGPMLTGIDHGRTTAPGPMLEALAIAETMMREPGMLSISVQAGFSTADISDAGPSVVVVGDGHDPRHRILADRLMAFVWETRHRSTVEAITAAEAVAVARAEGRPGRPVVIADTADNPGGGGYGDSTGLLRALLEAGLDGVAYGALYDPQSAAACHVAGIGAELELQLGGKVDAVSGAPVAVTGRVTALSDGRFRLEGPMQRGVPIDMGPSAAITVGGLRIVVASRRYQNYDRMFFRTLGIEPGDCAVVAVKSSQHFRAAYAPLASRVVVVDEGNGITTRDFSRRTYRNVRRPIYPLDLD